MGGGDLSPSRKRLILATCCMSLFMVGLDVTVVNLALPSIQRDLRTGVSGLQWVIDGYTIVIAGLLMLAGSTGDRIGRRRTFQAGLTIFTLGSLLCSLAPNLAALVVFRMVQAVGGSMLNPVAMSIITNVFTEPRERARALGFWAGTIGVSMAFGPVVGGLVVSATGWRGIFWVNIPVGIAALVLTRVFVPESRAPQPRRPDPVGQVLVALALASLVFAIIEGPRRGWTSPLILGCFALAAVAASGFVRYELRRTEPLLDPRFFRSLPLAGATLIAVLAFAAFGGFLLMATLYLQDVRGYPALRAGLYMLPLAAMTAIFGPLSGRIVAARGPRLPLVGAAVAITASALTMTNLTDRTSTGHLVLSYVLFGLGFGLVNPPITNTAVAGLPTAQAGVAAAIVSTSRQIGSALGVAIIGTAVVLALAEPLWAGFAQASHVGWWIVAACGLAIGGVGLATTSAHARRTADRVAAVRSSAPATSP